MSNNPIEHKDFIIQMQGNGFRLVPNAAGTVASFWVVGPRIRSVFAFMRSFSEAFDIEEDSEDKILEAAIEIIKGVIDSSRIQDLEEYTYEYRGGKFILVENVKWWAKTLRVRLST
jgi:hypothetical protein